MALPRPFAAVQDNQSHPFHGWLFAPDRKVKNHRAAGQALGCPRKGLFAGTDKGEVTKARESL